MEQETTKEELIQMILQLTKKNFKLEEQLSQARKREKTWYELWREKN